MVGDGAPLDSFASAFKALTGHQPFRWQRRLFDLFAEGQLPSAVDVPTGLGKTSVMALWLIAVGQGAALPRRLVYVVDRRAVVDQATRSAQQLRENVPPPLADELGLDDAGLPVSTLRGGTADNRAWLDDPSKPAVVVGTVDMVGSRLLFEGYGVSRGMRPYQAGFLGADALVVLDEAHLCPPFEALLRDIERQRDGKFGPVGKFAQADAFTPPFRLMSLSATGRPGDDERTTFHLERQDREEADVHRRLNAAKSLALHPIDDPKALPEELAERAIRLGSGDTPKRVVVYCDRRIDALQVKKAIDREIKAKPAKSELLVGARRVRERERLEGWLEEVGLLGGDQSAPEVPVFLVATSAGEVGVDMDADHMVGDLVAFERVVQRLGRVNRRGGAHRNAVVEVLCSRPQLKGSASAKDKLKLAQHDARERVLRALPTDAQGRYQASPEAFVDLKARHPSLVEAATTRPPLHPPLTRPHLEAWSMTSLAVHEGRTEVEPWLRGWEDEDDKKPQVEVAWRTHLPYRRVADGAEAPAEMVAAYFQCAPIHPTEKLETLRDHVEDWLLKRVQSLVKDTEKQPDGDAPKTDDIVAMIINRAGALVDKASFKDLTFLAQRALDNAEKVVQKRRKDEWRRTLSGALLVLDRRIGGLDTDGMLEVKSASPVSTVDGDDEWLAAEDAPNGAPRVKFRIVPTGAQSDGDGIPEGMDAARWLLTRHFETRLDEAGEVVAGLAVYKWADADTDEDSRSVQPRAQRLDEHAEQVAAQARRIAESLRLPAAEVEAMECAARLHDDGKAARRWQEAMNAPRCGGPYAKTKGGGSWRQLEGYRHEFGSLRKAEKMSLPSATKDLILHLVAAHHGNARPTIATAGCDEAPPTVLTKTARDAALRYARLQRRYGVWGLAWREAILRAADQTASRQLAASERSNDG